MPDTRSLQQWIDDAFAAHAVRTGTPRRESLQERCNVLDISVGTLLKVQRGEAVRPSMARKIAGKLFPPGDPAAEEFIRMMNTAVKAKPIRVHKPSRSTLSSPSPDAGFEAFVRHYTRPGGVLVFEMRSYGMPPLLYVQPDAVSRALVDAVSLGVACLFYSPQPLDPRLGDHQMNPFLGGRHAAWDAHGLVYTLQKVSPGRAALYCARTHASPQTSIGIFATGDAPEAGRRSFLWYEQKGKGWQWTEIIQQEMPVVELLRDLARPELLVPTEAEIVQIWNDKQRFRGLPESDSPIRRVI